MAPVGRFGRLAARPIMGEGGEPLPLRLSYVGELLLVALFCRKSTPGMLEVEEVLANLDEVEARL